MLKRILALAGVLVLVGQAWAGIGRVYNSDVSVTQTNSIVAFTDNGSDGTAGQFAARYVLVRSLSASANTCYFDVKDGVASTSDIALEPGGSISLTFNTATASDVDGWPNMGAICAAGQTATFRVTAMR